MPLRDLAQPLGIKIGSRVHRDARSQAIVARECNHFMHLMRFMGAGPGEHGAPTKAYGLAQAAGATSGYHAVFYPSADPKWYETLSRNERLREQHVRCEQIARKLGAARGVIQLLNEVSSWGKGSVNRTFPHYPEVDYHVQTFKIARQYFPRSQWRLQINEANVESNSTRYSNRGTPAKSIDGGGHWESFQRVIEEIGDVDIVGVQGHAGPGNEPGGRWEWQLQQRAKWFQSNGLAWEITEHDWWGPIETHDQWFELMKYMFRVGVDFGCETIGFWGITDHGSWALDETRAFYRPDNSPCLYHANGAPKPIYRELSNWLASQSRESPPTGSQNDGAVGTP